MKYTLNFSLSSAVICLCLIASNTVFAKSSISDDKFRQLDEDLPTPNVYRTASGAPGHEYWQQEVDYKIDIKLNDENQQLTGYETLYYKNNSPDTLRYIWLQLDQSRLAHGSNDKLTRTAPNKKITYSGFRNIIERDKFDGGNRILSVTDKNKKGLPYTINDTMMRIDLPKALKPGDSVEFNVEWTYQLHEQKVLGGRSGYEYFEKDDNYL